MAAENACTPRMHFLCTPGRVRVVAALFSCLTGGFFSCAQAAAPRYTVIDRGPSLVRTLVETPGFDPHGDLALWHPGSAGIMQGVVYHDRQTLEFSGEKEFSLVFPADLNDHLTVVGSVQAPQDLRFTRAFKWTENHLEILPSIGGPYSAASAINESGKIAGSAQTSEGTRHAVLWQDGMPPRDLGLVLNGDYSTARDINNKSDIVGEANVAPLGKPRGFLWHAGTMKLLPNLPGGTFCSAQAINDKDEIAGWCDLPNGASRGVIWRNGRITELGALGDDDSPSTALDINNQGQIVGSSEISDSKLRAFLWENGRMLNLNKAIDPQSGWRLLVASRINDKGEIAGRGFFHGSIHAFVLVPVTQDTPKNE
jgi:probable HAF family extracellular repeat protein